MKKTTLLLLASFYICSIQFSFSQNVKFGKVSKEELEEKFYPLDSSANAAVLYKKRSTYTNVIGGEIVLNTSYHYRIKIYNKEGFDWATKVINLYKSRNNEEKATSIKAYTYNLENDKIVKTKLEKSDIIKENKSEFIDVKKFTMPNLKEGSVIEFSYKISSPFFTKIDDAKVQYTIPVKDQHIKIVLLEWFHFNKRQKGFYPFKINESSQRNSDFDTNDKLIEIFAKNTPAIKEEPYVNNIENYSAALQFEVASLSAPRLGLFKTYTTNWEEVSKNINKNSSFGNQLKKTSHFEDDLASLIANTASNEEKIMKIFQFVKTKIKWNDYYSKYTNKGVKSAYKEGVGNVAEINLTLVSMLRKAGIDANPVLVSTRSHGIPIFPTSDGFNYVIAGVKTPQGNILLDATEKYSTPNTLPLRALNWQGRLISSNGNSEAINLLPKAYASNKTFVSAKIADDLALTGMKRTSLDNLLAFNYRNKKNKVVDDEIIANIEKEYSVDILDLKINNKNDLSKPVIETIKFESEDLIEEIGDKIYISPLLFLSEKENPFKLDQRLYPIDFGTPWQNKLNITIEIPSGYKVISLPEKQAIALPENLGIFKFLSAVKDNKIQIISSVNINSSIIAQNNYAALKEFYKTMITKQNEKIVLSKI